MVVAPCDNDLVDDELDSVIDLAASETPRIFVSHAGPDTAWAEWVSWQLLSAGYEVELDCWDWGPGDNLFLQINAAVERAGIVIAIGSAAYFEPGRFTEREWSAVLASGRRLLLLRIEEVTVPPILRSFLMKDLVGKSVEEARQILSEAVKPSKGRPLEEPGFPGGTRVGESRAAPRFPGQLPQVWNLPARSPTFMGRDDFLDALRTDLSAGTSPWVLHGPGGIGKSFIELEFAYRYASDYDMAWWIDSERAELISEQLVQLAFAAGWATTGMDAPTAISAAYQGLRRTSRWLLIFDNAKSPRDVREHLPMGPGDVLISSRDASWFGVALRKQVPLFERDESLRLLRTNTVNLSDAEADAVADAIGDLPLAVAQASGFLSETGITGADYVVAVRDHASEVFAEGAPATYPLPLAAVVQIGVDELASVDVAALQLLQICAFMGPEPVPPGWFAAAPDGLLAEPLASTVRKPVALHRSVGRLARYGLAILAHDAPELHRLTASIIRDGLDQAAFKSAEGIAHELCAAADPGSPDGPQYWPAWARLMPHLVALNLESTTNRGLREVAYRGALYLLYRRNVAACRDFSARLYEPWRQTFGGDDEFTLGIADTLAWACRESGQEESLALNRDIFDRRRRLYGPDDERTLTSATCLARDLRGRGQAEDAYALDRETLRRSRAALGRSNLLTLSSAQSVAMDLRALGDLGGALDLNARSFGEAAESLGPDHPVTLELAIAYATDLRESGRMEEAHLLDLRTLEAARLALGEGHPVTLRVTANLLQASS